MSVELRIDADGCPEIEILSDRQNMLTIGIINEGVYYAGMTDGVSWHGSALLNEHGDLPDSVVAMLLRALLVDAKTPDG